MILTKRFRFEASHQLPNHPGKCKNLHGHSWVLEVSVDGEINPETGMVIDYADIGYFVHQLIDWPLGLDHSHLNDKLPLPTSENLIVFIWKYLEPNLPICRIRLYETADCWAEMELVV